MRIDTPAPVPLLVDLHLQHVPAWRQLGTAGWALSGLQGVFWAHGTPDPEALALVSPSGPLRGAQWCTGDLWARCTTLPETGDVRGQELLVAHWLNTPQRRRSIHLPQALASLLAAHGAWLPAVDDLVARIQALPVEGLGLLEIGGFQRWSADSALTDHRVPPALWEALATLHASGHAPAVRLAWERDIPPLSVLLDEARCAREALA